MTSTYWHVVISTGPTYMHPYQKSLISHLISCSCCCKTRPLLPTGLLQVAYCIISSVNSPGFVPCSMSYHQHNEPHESILLLEVSSCKAPTVVGERKWRLRYQLEQFVFMWGLIVPLVRPAHNICTIKLHSILLLHICFLCPVTHTHNIFT